MATQSDHNKSLSRVLSNGPGPITLFFQRFWERFGPIGPTQNNAQSGQFPQDLDQIRAQTMSLAQKYAPKTGFWQSWVPLDNAVTCLPIHVDPDYTKWTKVRTKRCQKRTNWQNPTLMSHLQKCYQYTNSSHFPLLFLPDAGGIDSTAEKIFIPSLERPNKVSLCRSK